MNILNLKKYYKKILLIFIIFLFIRYILYEFIISKNVAESATNKYLNSLNINKDEIESIEIYFNFKRSPGGYDIIIIYKDEPNLKYRYRYIIKNSKFILDNIFNNGSIIALEEVGKVTKPLHETPINVELLISEDYVTLKNKNYMEYTFFNYLKDLIVQ